MIAFQSTIHDGGISLLGDAFLGHFGIDPVGVPPHLGADLAKLDGGRGVVGHDVFERLVELAVVEEHVRVMIPAVEMALDGLDGLDDTFQLLVSREDDEGSIGSGPAGVGFQAARDEYFVVVFADFSVSRGKGFLV